MIFFVFAFFIGDGQAASLTQSGCNPFRPKEKVFKCRLHWKKRGFLKVQKRSGDFTLEGFIYKGKAWHVSTKDKKSRLHLFYGPKSMRGKALDIDFSKGSQRAYYLDSSPSKGLRVLSFPLFLSGNIAPRSIETSRFGPEGLIALHRGKIFLWSSDSSEIIKTLDSSNSRSVLKSKRPKWSKSISVGPNPLGHLSSYAGMLMYSFKDGLEIFDFSGKIVSHRLKETDYPYAATIEKDMDTPLFKYFSTEGIKKGQHGVGL